MPGDTSRLLEPHDLHKAGNEFSTPNGGVLFWGKGSTFVDIPRVCGRLCIQFGGTLLAVGANDQRRRFCFIVRTVFWL